jgi:hypothetical protein
MRLNKGIPTLPTLNKIPFGLGFIIPFGLGFRHPASGVLGGPIEKLRDQASGFLKGRSVRNQASGFRDHCSYNSKFYCFTFLFF